MCLGQSPKYFWPVSRVVVVPVKSTSASALACNVVAGFDMAQEGPIGSVGHDLKASMKTLSRVFAVFK
eukprot:CAMPEP_0172936890 /NCGR_PEP_ID=MMETSP1075-20121228/222249_1 /TAXON_ID=2916 /ORGANISM="Ceratium fusus, Strain PA161109" /LENGTH=67 /DNA_ID=CAMNT_0013798263 /DNA_START=614 /DNA_END=817 /DNA_ORIENTATION=+